MKIGWSNFALKQNKKNKKFKRIAHMLPKLVYKHWKHRKPGAGRNNLKQVVVVPILEKDISKLFSSSWADISQVKRIVGKVTKRQPNEDSFVEYIGTGKSMPAKFAKIVLYSADTLLENNGERSGDYDWEIVAILTGPWENEPMMPLTMARNFLQAPGGTYAPYTAWEFAHSIYFWSRYIRVKAPNPPKKSIWAL